MSGPVVVLGTVQGLVAERARVRDAFAKAQPRAVALGISPESAAALLRYAPVEGADPFDELPDAELAYAARLQAFGDVSLPPPDLLEAAALAREQGVPIFGVDLAEERYEDLFTHEVGAWSLLRYGRAQRRLAKRPPEAADARAFALAWDAHLRRIPALARVEAAREAHIAQAAQALAQREGGAALLVVDVAREAGVQAALLAGSEERRAQGFK